jgi:hypothetical protein
MEVAAVSLPTNNILEKLLSFPADCFVVRAPVQCNGSLFVTPTDVRRLFLDSKVIIEFEGPQRARSHVAGGRHTVYSGSCTFKSRVIAVLLTKVMQYGLARRC